jgi:hypothetical protein
VLPVRLGEHPSLGGRRRGHAPLAFLFTSVIVALLINTVASLLR